MNTIEYLLFTKGKRTYVIDGDNLRHGINKDLGFSEVDRVENIRRAGEIAKLFVDAGIIVLASFITPFQKDRDNVRSMFDKDDFAEIFVDAPVEVCEMRDPKGLYKKVRNGELSNFTGIDSPYETPVNPDLLADTVKYSPQELAETIIEKFHLN